MKLTNHMEKYIDLSPISGFIGIVSFVATFFLVKFLIEKYKDPEDETLSEGNVIGITIAVSAVFALMSLMFYKKYLVHSGSKSLLNEGFYDP